MDIQFGVDYYPEHWPKERWPVDARLMKEMGVDVARMAEFSWSKLEPREGEFNFGWLDEAVDLLAAHGIKSILGTPSAAPPAWIIEKTPDIQPIDSHGVRHYFGGRHHDCQSNAVYRAHCRRYAEAFAAHFAKNPNVIGWQIDNELGNSHADLCFCPSCESRYREWLKEKYQTIEALNAAWGTIFWSQGYLSFDQIHAPRLTAAGRNPSAMLDWKRFCSDLIIDFHEEQARILREAAPDKFITHNMMGFADKVNYFDLAEKIDFSSHDQYPGGFRPGRSAKASGDRGAAALDLIRATKGKSFWIMEQQAGIAGWEIMGRAPRPGQLPLWAMQSVAHGADTVVFFRWRTCSVGTEQYWHGVLPHSGIPGRNYEELKAFIKDARPVLKKVKGALPKASAAIVYSYDQLYAFQIQPHHPELGYVDHVMTYYRALYERNIPVDFVRDDADLSGYDLVIAPLQYLTTPELVKRYEAYVGNGGNLVLTMRAGVKDDSNLCHTDGPLPGLLAGLAGIEVREYDCMRDMSNIVAFGGGQYECVKWCDIITPTSAKPLAWYGAEFYAGTPAITVNDYSKGHAYYVGTEMGGDLAAAFMAYLAVNTGLCPLGEAPEGVEIAHRRAGDTDYLFVLNHTEEAQAFEVPPDWKSCAGGPTDARLEPYGYRVYTRRA